MPDDDGSPVRREDVYEALRDQGASKEKAARIANAQASGDIDHDGRAYEDRTRDELYELAREREISGRSDMTKSELIAALRDD